MSASRGVLATRFARMKTRAESPPRAFARRWSSASATISQEGRDPWEAVGGSRGRRSEETVWSDWGAFAVLFIAEAVASRPKHPVVKTTANIVPMARLIIVLLSLVGVNRCRTVAARG